MHKEFVILQHSKFVRQAQDICFELVRRKHFKRNFICHAMWHFAFIHESLYMLQVFILNIPPVVVLLIPETSETIILQAFLSILCYFIFSSFCTVHKNCIRNFCSFSITADGIALSASVLIHQVYKCVFQMLICHKGLIQFPDDSIIYKALKIINIVNSSAIAGWNKTLETEVDSRVSCIASGHSTV